MSLRRAMIVQKLHLNNPAIPKWRYEVLLRLKTRCCEFSRPRNLLKFTVEEDHIFPPVSRRLKQANLSSGKYQKIHAGNRPTPPYRSEQSSAYWTLVQ